ncbi:hypothetical protein F0919_03535 [Taibaiella lutea]|uniref:Outer membrane protein beta-barrel domain-containing protein n=1 Tax=Taibaiella lutea TaxID=2608001 RepID=A0A5M6CNP3_9BACT|nr:hypothetical protein [Taibaiella lutea]KAA5536754.1 hypothetical protein F0919_03535 [Taibaiella lutea]
MNRKLLQGFILLLLIIGISSCQQKMYFPDRANSPGLTKALEAKATFSMKPQANDNSEENSSVGSSIDLAFSPVNHFGIIASYRWINDRVIHENDGGGFWGIEQIGGRFNGKRWEIGVGYYDTIGSKGFVEAYGGYGNGSLNRVGITNPQYNYDTKYNRFFIQPALGFKLGNYFTLSGGFRTAFLTFYDFKAPDPQLKYEIGNSGKDVTAPIYVFFEPFFNFEGGYKFFKGNIQVGAANQINNAKIAGNFPVYISIGMTFTFRLNSLIKAVSDFI